MMTTLDKEVNQRRQERDQCRRKICSWFHCWCYCPNHYISDGGM